MVANFKSRLKNYLLLAYSFLFSPIYVPHFILMSLSKSAREKIFADVNRMKEHLHIKIGEKTSLLYLLHTNRYFRNLFYFRLGPVKSIICSWYRPGDRYFVISPRAKMEGGVFIVHPCSTWITAEYIGKNFTCLQNTTIGKSEGKRPYIEDNVTLGAGVNIVGNVHIGRGCQIGAGAVVRSNTPPYSVVIGNPAKVVGFIYTPEEVIALEKDIYPEENRLSLETLEKNYNKYFINRIKEIKAFNKSY